MTDLIAVCPDHGPHARVVCPRCGARGERLLDGRRRRQLSTFCSGALRHFPDDAGITLDAAGWCPLDALVDAVDRRYDWAGDREVNAVVAADPKGRFEIRGGDDAEIRAAYGHSVDVDLDRDREGEGDPDDDVPGTLYHGTAPRTLDAISEEGLRPMGRQAVHLSADPETAASVGRRRAAEPVVFVVDADGLAAAGFEIRLRGRDTYTVARVPPRFLARGGTT